MTEFFRHCPACGRRFHIKLVKKEVLHKERDLVPTKQVTFQVGGAGAPRVLEGAPIVLDIEEFQYQYKCGHCSHEWSENRNEEHKED